MEIIVRSFKPHYNSAMGKVIRNEREYKEEMKRGNYIPYEQAKEQVEANKEKRRQFAVSEKAQEWMRDVRSSADSHGNVKMSDRQIEMLKETGTVTNRDNPALNEAMKDYQG